MPSGDRVQELINSCRSRTEKHGFEHDCTVLCHRGFVQMKRASAVPAATKTFASVERLMAESTSALPEAGRFGRSRL